MSRDPALAMRVDTGLRSHYTVNTASSYDTGANDYVRFCRVRGLTPWPVDEVAFCGWLHVTADRIMMSSTGMYMAGVRNASILEGHGWDMTGNESVRRTIRFLRRKHPAKAKGQKVPITVGVLQRILPLLPNWPDMSRMSEDDRVFAAASVIGVAGFLRGGEFLAYPKSTRPGLKAHEISVRQMGDLDAVIVKVRQPKARWWLKDVSVPCFQNVTDDAICPVRLWQDYAARCPKIEPDGPAFLRRGHPLSRSYMVTRTTELMKLANISFVDNRGGTMNIKAASWRSGAACSAVQAHVSVPHIMALGRWSSEAWENYILQAPLDLQGPAGSMWAGARLQLTPTTSGLGLESFDVGGFFAPFIAQSLNNTMSVLGIDVNCPPRY